MPHVKKIVLEFLGTFLNKKNGKKIKKIVLPNASFRVGSSEICRGVTSFRRPYVGFEIALTAL